MSYVMLNHQPIEVQVTGVVGHLTYFRTSTGNLASVNSDQVYDSIESCMLADCHSLLSSADKFAEFMMNR